jgi:urea transport system permease protein
LFALGALFVLVTLYLPNGLMGLRAQLKDRKIKRAQLKASSLSASADSQEQAL